MVNEQNLTQNNELKEIFEKTKDLFECETVEELKEKILYVTTNNKQEFFEEFLHIQKNLNEDLMQKIFQYHMADRKEKMQDFTPVSLAKLACKISDSGNTVFDMCAGSGALTIQSWAMYSQKKHVCYEIDENVIPFLLFNLMLRNIDGYVIHGDVLKSKIFKTYKLTKSNKFSKLEEVEEITKKCDSLISNPPYNIKWKHPPFAQILKPFKDCELPPESNANFAFILIGNSIIKNKAAYILPNGVLTTENKNEKEVRKYLVDKNLIDAVIICPEKMFEATNIPTCILLINKNKTDTKITMIDYRKECVEKTREQRGQFGGNSHEKRVYKKTINAFTDEQIEKCAEYINKRIDFQSISRNVTIETVKQNDYKLVPSQYIEFKNELVKTRDYLDIVKDLNRIIGEKNNCKLTINETLAKSLGFDIELYKKKDELNDKELSKLIEKLSGEKIVKENYFTTTKNKNEIKFENASKDTVSSILMMTMQMWKQHIYYLNNEENRYLAELRDKLLHEMMIGKIKV